MMRTMPRSSVVSLGLLLGLAAGAPAGAWSFAIGEPSGVMLATIAKGDGTAFVIEGFCAVKN